MGMKRGGDEVWKADKAGAIVVLKANEWNLVRSSINWMRECRGVIELGSRKMINPFNCLLASGEAMSWG